MGELTLPLSEVFGPTWQGEGPHAGLRVGFVRLGLCNLSCSWCDTPYTWDRSRFDLAVECPPTPIGTILARAREIDVETFVLSGGEPLIHHRHLEALLTRRWTWHVETNGTIPPPPWWRERVAHTSVSPKVATDDPLARRIRLSALAGWAELAAEGLACFKFVARDAADLDEVAAVVALADLPPRSVWVMPEGTDAPSLLERHRALADGIMERGWNTTTRLHVLLFGATRGV